MAYCQWERAYCQWEMAYCQWERAFCKSRVTCFANLCSHFDLFSSLSPQWFQCFYHFYSIHFIIFIIWIWYWSISYILKGGFLNLQISWIFLQKERASLTTRQLLQCVRIKGMGYWKVLQKSTKSLVPW